MSKQIDTHFSTGRIRFTFSDDGGEVFSSCLINPTDVKLADRVQHLADKVGKIVEDLKGQSGEYIMSALKEANDKLEALVAEAVGYDGAREELFGAVTATTVSDDGELFVTCLLRRLCEELGPAIVEKNRAAVEKYTAKYEDGQQRNSADGV